MTVPSIARAVALGVFAVAAYSSPVPPAGAPAPQPTVRERVTIGERFSPRTGDAAIKAFVADVAPVEGTGECVITRTGPAGATMASVYYPSRVAAVARVGITFDSAGHVVRYSEQRGGVRITGMRPDMSDAQRDSVMRAAEAAARTTGISFDYPLDQAVASNRGGGKPTNAVFGQIRLMQSLESLGNPQARMERMRKFCGV